MVMICASVPFLLNQIDRSKTFQVNEQGVVVLTGATSGLGKDAAFFLAQKGFHVVAGARTQAKAQALRDEAQAAKRFPESNLEVIVFEAGEESHYKRAVEVAAAAMERGGIPFTGLINNAGVADGRWRNLTEIDDSWALEVLDINALGPVRVVKALYGKMNHDSLTKIAMVSSLMASIDDCHIGRSYAYRASKTALNMFTVAMKKEAIEDNITFVILHPGWVKTDMGGDRAPVEIPDSISGMREVLETRTLDNSGEFVQFDGALLPW